LALSAIASWADDVVTLEAGDELAWEEPEFELDPVGSSEVAVLDLAWGDGEALFDSFDGEGAEDFEDVGKWLSAIGQGAATGAATGAAAGPWGALIGALAGGGLGALQTGLAQQQQPATASKPPTQAPPGPPPVQVSATPSPAVSQPSSPQLDQLATLVAQLANLLPLLTQLATSPRGSSEGERSGEDAVDVHGTESDSHESDERNIVDQVGDAAARQIRSSEDAQPPCPEGKQIRSTEDETDESFQFDEVEEINEAAQSEESGFEGEWPRDDDAIPEYPSVDEAIDESADAEP
jgi:hypothetical protein